MLYQLEMSNIVFIVYEILLNEKYVLKCILTVYMRQWAALINKKAELPQR